MTLVPKGLFDFHQKNSRVFIFLYFFFPLLHKSFRYCFGWQKTYHSGTEEKKKKKEMALTELAYLS